MKPRIIVTGDAERSEILVLGPNAEVRQGRVFDLLHERAAVTTHLLHPIGHGIAGVSIRVTCVGFEAGRGASEVWTWLVSEFTDLSWHIAAGNPTGMFIAIGM